MLLAFAYIFLGLLNFVFYVTIAFAFPGMLTLAVLALGLPTVGVCLFCFHNRLKELPNE